MVLSLFIFSSAYSDEPRVWYKDENTIHIAHKSHLWDWHTDIKRIAEQHCKSHNKYYFWVKDNNLKTKIGKYYKDKIKSEYKKANVIEIFCSDKLLSYAPNESFTPGNDFSYTNFKSTAAASNNNSSNNQTSTNDKIANSKKICKELGFKANTEKFSDCALKMMALQFETGNKVSNNDGSSTQKIIIQQQDDFDIGDFFFGLQKIVDDNYRSTNNSSNQGTNCRIVPKAWGADMVCR